jgi:hypothetical protein
MGMGKNTKDRDKKKGPKGKKARAMAKLDRQWGEVAVKGDETQTKRIGNSRLLANTQKESSIRGTTTVKGGKNGDFDSNKQKRRRRTSAYSSSDDSSDDDSDKEGSAVTNLLTSIRKANRKKQKIDNRKRKRVLFMKDEKNSENDDDDQIMEEDHPTEDEQVESSEDESDNESLKDDDASLDQNMNDDNDKTATDSFRQRFSRQPLPRSEITADAPPIKKVPVDSSLELQVSAKVDSDDHLLVDLFVTEKEPKQVLEHWKKCAQMSFEGTRKVLKPQWKRFNNKGGFTASQAPVYSSLTRYADLFVTSDSLEVRIALCFGTMK